MSGLVSIGEILHVFFEKKDKNNHKNTYKQIKIDDIIKLAKENDIIEIKAEVNGRKILLGSASECERNGLNFFDKIYFIEKQEFVDIVLFENKLKNLSPDGFIDVLKIDDVSPDKYHI